ncbi:unnamed protein product [Auanema sp. JU1783]|nr:unnamed protein product [Auanema sp. JU1783]
MVFVLDSQALDFHPLLATAPMLPGVRVRLQQRGITYLTQVFSNILADQLPRLLIPDVEQKLNNHQGVIRISRIRISRFRRAEIQSLTPSSPNRISWTMSNLDLGLMGDLSGNVNIVLPFNLTGQAEVIAEGLTFHLDSSMEKSLNGSAHIQTLSCMATIRNVQVINHNGGLFGLAVTVFKQGVSDNVRQLLQGLICKKVRKYLDEDLNSKLSEVQSKSRLSEAVESNAIRAIPTVNGKKINIMNLFGKDLSKDFLIDFRLKDSPICDANSIEVSSLGEISLNGMGGTPFGPAIMNWPPISQQNDDYMLQLLISDYLANSLFYHAYKNHLIHILLTEKTEGVSSFLRTNCDSSFCISDILPQLAENYPNSTLEIALSATRAPALLFSEKNGGVISISVGAVIIIFVIKDNSRKQAAVIDLDAVADAHLNLQANNVSGSVQLTKFDLQNRFNGVQITNDELADISLLVSQLLENMFNEMLVNGFPLPIPRVIQLYRIKLDILTRRIYIRTDITVDEKRLSKLAAQTLFNGPGFRTGFPQNPVFAQPFTTMSPDIQPVRRPFPVAPHSHPMRVFFREIRV